MSSIQKLAQLCAEKIQKDQHSNTSEDRRQGLRELRKYANGFVSDNTIIEKVMLIKNEVYNHGYFGFRGRGGSTFLKHINEFLNQASYVQKQRSEGKIISTSGVPELARMIADEIKAKQNASTDQSRIDALTAFFAKINEYERESHYPKNDDKRRNYSDESLITLAKTLYQDVNEHGKFGLFGKNGSHFLKKMKEFIDQAEILHNLEIESIKRKIKYKLETTLGSHQFFTPLKINLDNVKIDLNAAAIKNACLVVTEMKAELPLPALQLADKQAHLLEKRDIVNPLYLEKFAELSNKAALTMEDSEEQKQPTIRFSK